MAAGTEQTPDGVRISVPSHPKYLYVLRSVLYPLALDAGFTKRDARRIVLAVDEACSNIIKYAYEGDSGGRIEVGIVTETQGIRITVKDQGKKPDPAMIAPRDLADIRPGGLGTHFMQTVFDSVVYDTSGAQGTVLTLEKTLDEGPGGKNP